MGTRTPIPMPRTPEEAQRMCRTAFEQGFIEGADWADAVDEHEARNVAGRTGKLRYPIQTTRPREVTDSAGTQWRVADGQLQARLGKIGTWECAEGKGSLWRITPERVRIWADLYANPTETVDE